jgi:hypothetical protein
MGPLILRPSWSPDLGDNTKFFHLNKKATHLLDHYSILPSLLLMVPKLLPEIFGNLY